MQLIIPLLPDHENIRRIHKLLAHDRRSHTISQVEYGFFHEVRGTTQTLLSTIIDIFVEVDREWLEESIKGIDWTESDVEFISISDRGHEELIPFKGWSIGRANEEKENV